MSAESACGQSAATTCGSSLKNANRLGRALLNSVPPSPGTTQIPARQGEHNEEILKELGLTDDEISALAESGALVEPSREINETR